MNHLHNHRTRTQTTHLTLIPTIWLLTLFAKCVALDALEGSQAADVVLTDLMSPIARRSLRTTEEEETDALEQADEIRAEDVEVFGRLRSRLPLFLDDVESCHAACEEQRDCVGWMFRVTLLRCHIFVGDLQLKDCVRRDCVAGIFGHRLTGAESLDAFREDIEKIRKQPQERYRGRTLTCKERDVYKRMSAVLVACYQVQKRCGPSSSKIDGISLPPVSCSPDKMINHTNVHGRDVNNGFDELTLTPEDCCQRCLETRRCIAWTRTASGQCWLKHEVEVSGYETISGDVSGLLYGSVTPKNVGGTVGTLRQAKCGKYNDGIGYSMEDPDGMDEENAEDEDECCQICTEKNLCTGWSYFQTNTTCRIFFGYDGRIALWEDGAVTAFMEKVPEECDDRVVDEEPIALDIAAAYRPDCSAILQFGPTTPTTECPEIEAAHQVFYTALERVQRVFKSHE